jgi:hypothetical protein
MDLQYKITYKQGPTNLVVDALSRCHPTNIVAPIIVCSPAWIDRVKEGYVDEDNATLKGSRCPRGEVNWAFLKIKCKN